MNTLHTDGMVSWKLKNTMDAHSITRYALQKESGVAMNTLRGMYDGTTKRPDLEVLDSVIRALRQISSKEITLANILEWQA
ncbi:helix-turn-helix domain-containing protein [Deinococcus rubellus]|uniref:Helix-turn-helix transcriptional regulator n=1 Tax=Deinococcus rubellus TaxID=1889240 RepID=A0ABY5YHZ1_9DEIO|nr:helix-turn-helix transcriptional regulator [Deinococcus rubellus]UWX64725.1 helix-turn-helix transcriptional regulator [Deinococcus rubellus]